jgi:hypothetical protein
MENLKMTRVQQEEEYQTKESKISPKNPINFLRVISVNHYPSPAVIRRTTVTLPQLR